MHRSVREVQERARGFRPRAVNMSTAAMRVTKQFESGRKLAKTHQNVLVFCKGDWKKAAARCAAGIGNA